jgi:transposase
LHKSPIGVHLGFMRKSPNPAGRGFDGWDRRRLSKALAQAGPARFFRRVQAVLLVAQGRKIIEVTQITGLSRRAIYYLLKRYLRSHRVEDLADQPRCGRPVEAPQLTRRRILRELGHSPLQLGYRTNVWTVKTLALRLNERYQCSIGLWALRQRMKQIGLVCKRPRYFYSEKAPHVAQKKGGHRAPTSAHALPCRAAL